MYSLRRTCQLAARNANSACVYANGSRRAFSNTCARSKGGLPVFAEASSSELSKTLSEINAKVLLPEHLSREQQKLVYKESQRNKLETEPVEVTIGDVTLPLQHLDRNHLPPRWQSLKTVINLSETREDWENVVRVLEGYSSAGIAVKPDWQALVVRKLNQNGQHSLVLKALQRVKATGVRLSNPGVTRKILVDARDRAAEAKWEKEETAKALRYTKQIVELMEDEEHHSIKPKGQTEPIEDCRSKPYVIAVPTELAAVAAKKHDGDVETVKTFANRLVNALKQDPSNVSNIDRITERSTKTEADFKNKLSQTSNLNAHCDDLVELLIIWNALKTSKAVLGADMPLAEEAAAFEDKIKSVLLEGLESTAKLQRRGDLELRSRFPAYLRSEVDNCMGQ